MIVAVRCNSYALCDVRPLDDTQAATPELPKNVDMPSRTRIFPV